MLENATGHEIGWVNNEQIGFVTKPQAEDYSFWNSPTTFYNPYEDTEITILPDYPDIQGLDNYYHLGELAFTGVSYNPTLELAVYNLLQDNKYIVLWDRIANQEIARVSNLIIRFVFI